MTSNVCKYCRLWKPDPITYGTGYCHKRINVIPTRIIQNDATVFKVESSLWAKTSSDDWCDEFKPTNNKAEWNKTWIPKV